MINIDLSGVPVDVNVTVYQTKDPWYTSTVFGIPLYMIAAAAAIVWMVQDGKKR